MEHEPRQPDEPDAVEELGELGATSEVLLGLFAEWADGRPDWTNVTVPDFLQGMYVWTQTFEPGWRAQGRDAADGWAVFRHALLAGRDEPGGATRAPAGGP